MSLQLKVAVFIALSIGLGWISPAALLNVRSHGFYRFFAFEAILALVLLNLEFWFDDPLSLQQMASWLLLLASLLLVIHGFLLLRKLGKPDRRRDDPSLIGIEKTTELVTAGAYRYIRHPIYSSGLIGVWGVFLKHLSWAGLWLAVAATVFWVLTARIEEAENVRCFGTRYRDYMKRTRMFIPFLF